MKRLIIFLFALVLTASAAQAAGTQINFVNVTGTGTYNSGTGASTMPGNLAPLTDGYFPPEATHWQSNTTWSYGPGYDTDQEVYTFDMGATYLVQDITLSVDNNDSYVVEYSLDGASWDNLFTISSGYGEIGWGMDTFTTVAGDSEYLSALDFAAVQAQYLRIYWASGDGMYSVGEFQAFGTPTPIPGAVWLLGSGLAGLVGLRRRMRG